MRVKKPEIKFERSQLQVLNIQARHIYLTSFFYCKLHGRPKINVHCKNHSDLDDLVGRGKAAPNFLVWLEIQIY